MTQGSAEKTSAHVMISGRVQGVFFRAETQKAAHRIGVNGWVRNTADGRVEAVFEGDREQVEQMIQWCWEGSPSARVENVEAEHRGFRGEFDGFSVRH
jgi:acylphosphatase